MFTKYNGVRDDELVFSYKERPDDDIEIELIERYKIHSKKLAGELYQNYRFVFKVEYDDLYSIALANLFIAIRSYKKKQSFFKLWKTIATNEINYYVSGLPLVKINKEMAILTTSRDLSFDNLVIASPSYHNPVDDLMMLLRNNNFELKDKDEDILCLYLSGYSARDIANETGLKYYDVLKRVNALKAKLSNILFSK